MRSVRIRATGAPDVVRVDDVPLPRGPRGDELLVRVSASSINGTDIGIRRGDLPLLTALPRAFPLGFDFSGTVVGTGPAVTGFRTDDLVCGLIGHAGGAQSDLVLVRQGRVALIPPEVTTTEAGVLPLAGLTALQGLYRPGALPGRGRPRVLILGASGGIGSFAVQLARQAGASVTAATTARTTDFVLRLGADEVIDRDSEDPLGASRRWDVIFDTAGRSRLAHALPALRAGGIFVTTRGISTDEVRARARRRRTSRFAAVRTAPRSIDLAHLLRLIRDQSLQVPIARSYPVADIVSAHRAADTGAAGKIAVVLNQ